MNVCGVSFVYVCACLCARACVCVSNQAHCGFDRHVNAVMLNPGRLTVSTSIVSEETVNYNCKFLCS